MPAGRPPKPTALKILTGNPGKRPLPKGEPVPPPGDVRAPAWLKGTGRRLWPRAAEILTAMGVLTTADPYALGLLLDALGEYIDCRDVVRKLGATYESRVLKASTRRVEVNDEFDGQPHGGALKRRRMIEDDDDEFSPDDWSVVIRPRPEVKMASDAWRRVQRMMIEFGLTPSSRSKLAAGEDGAEDDPLEGWMRGHRGAG